MNPYLAAILATSLDYSSTKYAISQGAYESNPLLTSQLEIKKGAQVLVLGYAIHKLDKKNPKLSKKVKIGMFILNGLVAAHNINQGRKANANLAR